MSSYRESLGLLQLSAVHEMANIGLGHAVTALTDLTGRSFNMSIPNVDTAPVSKVTELIGDPEQISVGILMPFEGDAEGYTAFLFPWESAQNLWKMLLGEAPNSPDELNELHASAMLETGNIINSNFLNALADMTNLKMHATPPMVSVDMVCSIAASIACEAETRESIALAIETSIYNEDGETSGCFLCIPTKDALEKLFAQLGISEAA